ncbi:NADPH-dependent FMN reductase [Paracoccus tegillarcae]|uniref:NADPH-dependent FMN reductase n=1 Tax=Paracoccus tegillarcae TaxID=1529068 RepID=A0A2K9EFH3_9RHOB|nr:NAD(P)H-dependent oxidoreductase [Paracoccus tegillarcae]AUH33710.1 NADPH-dependent FMN reductase [Paracoccus tegillarcae]
MKLNVIIVSTRPGRVGKPVGDWFFDHARNNPSGFDEVVLTDLAQVNLPLYDEPKHPRLQEYEHDHTKAWSKIVADSDAFVFVLPEYDFNAPPSYYNALVYLFNEWNYKPAGFVSYGGISGGLRATQSAKAILTTLKMMPVPDQVVMPMVFEHLSDDGLKPTKPMIESADAMLPELAKWATALKTMR